MELTRNFNLTEFKCKDGAGVPLHFLPNVQKLAEQLQVIRDCVGKPLYINSAYRTYEHNRNVGGSLHSQHLKAKAADLRVEGLSSNLLHELILELIDNGDIINGGVGLYNSFVHYDIRNKPARW